ncbi:MAG: VOC family protein [Lentisphaerae bacterium]|nr:VOC family protein [Lentisphaerota bacterium]
MIKGLAHVCFRVKDLSVSEDFYAHKLGLKRAFDFRKPSGEIFGIYFYAGARNFIELFAGGPPTPAGPSSFQHFCLEVDAFHDFVGTLRERGVEVTGTKLGDDGAWQGWITDPDGNRIELHCYTPESRQLPFLPR